MPVTAAQLLTEVETVLTTAEANLEVRRLAIDETASASALAAARQAYTIAGGVVSALRSARRSIEFLT